MDSVIWLGWSGRKKHFLPSPEVILQCLQSPSDSSVQPTRTFAPCRTKPQRRRHQALSGDRRSGLGVALFDRNARSTHVGSGALNGRRARRLAVPADGRSCFRDDPFSAPVCSRRAGVFVWGSMLARGRAWGLSAERNAMVGSGALVPATRQYSVGWIETLSMMDFIVTWADSQSAVQVSDEEFLSCNRLPYTQESRSRRIGSYGLRCSNWVRTKDRAFSPYFKRRGRPRR